MPSFSQSGSGPAETQIEADAALMRRIASGDRGAARELMERSLPLMLAIGRRMLRDPAEAEDVAQDAFIRAWNAAARWKPGHARLESWMSRIATNLCLDRLRKKRETAMDSPPEMEDSRMPADDEMIASEASLTVNDAIATLPERQRLALELCHFQDFTNIEAAEQLDISVEALESLLARARRKLKAVLMPQRDDLVSSLTVASGKASEAL
ncbi:RNA polymerase sigma factor [Hyphobacterium sp. HN65]|uniref:RNA polymerase sigma factor n=1 Tax=Hyphobacterium lacteum TaxID=3116575 RepID=A0ABU7LT42_9PROT|nr:RNA polymerase sigma factor [Hyphobacterium sp. HN65]MEE2527074.1 RNA polymerase sigma factor [Hyphobacterium sp. HN65]